jgi:CubicO group peptidase (beta-lactamase class C family)
MSLPSFLHSNFISLVIASISVAAAEEVPVTGLAPEITDLNSEDVSFQLEKDLPYLKKPFINPSPGDRNDDIPVGTLGADGGNKNAVLAFAEEIAAGDHGEVDSLLLCKDGKLIFESYYRRGRVNYPHYQMSITKSYTAMAVGRAIQLGHLTMEDLEKPVVDFLKEIDRNQLVEGADQITLAEAMNMHSGIRISKLKAAGLMKTPEMLKDQGQVQTYLTHSQPIPPSPRDYKYQGSDPSMTMQVVEVTTPGTSWKFLEKELLGKMGIRNFAWQEDISGLPKSAAGSSMRSRDMLKWGLLVINDGQWKGEQIVPAEFVELATSRIHTNPQGTSYGFFWWRHDASVEDQTFDCISGRGAGGQFILMFPEIDLIAIVTAHNKGMGKMLKTLPERVVPGFLK